MYMRMYMCMDAGLSLVLTREIPGVRSVSSDISPQGWRIVPGVEADRKVKWRGG